MRSRVVLSILALGALAILIGLGTWQLQRLNWKNALSAKIEARIGQPPVSLDEVWDARQAGADIAYMPVRVDGVFQHNRERHVYALHEGKYGWHVYTPLKMADGRLVFVNRGFVPERLKEASSRDPGPEGPVVVQGLVRVPPPETSIFTPKSDFERNRFFWRDFTNMVASVYNKTEVSFAPFFIDQFGPRGAVEPDWPRAGVTRVKLPNRHLEYAITWYGLALTLVGVYGFFVFGGKRNEVQ